MQGGQLPSAFPEVADRQALRRFLADHIDMQFEDVRAVMRLPNSTALGTTGGGNFLAASALLAIVSGASTLFLDAGPHAFERPYKNQERFLRVLTYMPWDAAAAGIGRGPGARRLWQFARNPLAHAFGVDYNPGKATGQVPNILQWSLAVEKRAYSVKEIAELEMSVEIPAFAGVPLRRIGHHPEEFVLNVAGLYWAINRMLHALFADRQQSAEADGMAGLLVKGWEKT